MLEESGEAAGGGVVEENASRRTQARALKADVKHSFVFMMRHILRFLARLTVFQKHKREKNQHVPAFLLEMNINGQRGKRTGRLSPSLPVVDTFLNTVEK